MRVQYDPKTDAVVYGDVTKDFTKEDWVRLALACLDQAGIHDFDQAYIGADIEKALDKIPSNS
jgi:hypothetical protein